MSHDDPAAHGPPRRYRIRLEEPPSSGVGLKKTGLAIVILVVLIAIFSNTSSDREVRGPSDIDLSSTETADEVVREAKKLSPDVGTPATAPIEREPKGRPDNGSFIELNGVQFTLDVPVGWTQDRQSRQIFLRKPADGRVCQLTSNQSFNVAAFKGDALGNEVAYEEALAEELLTIGVQGAATVEVDGGIMYMSLNGPSYRYAVRLHIVMNAGKSSTSRLAINATAIDNTMMVRLQCMNMGGLADNGNEMERLARSLAVKS
jgi:hypothetical protein